MRFAWDNIPYAVPRVLDISTSTRDHMQMAMEDGLARTFTIIQADGFSHEPCQVSSMSPGLYVLQPCPAHR
jgi:hypothetical protein